MGKQGRRRAREQAGKKGGGREKGRERGNGETRKRLTEGARARRAGNEGRSRVENWESHLPAPQYKVRRRKGGVWAGRKEVS